MHNAKINKKIAYIWRRDANNCDLRFFATREIF